MGTLQGALVPWKGGPGESSCFNSWEERALVGGAKLHHQVTLDVEGNSDGVLHRFQVRVRLQMGPEGEGPGGGVH